MKKKRNRLKLYKIFSLYVVRLKDVSLEIAATKTHSSANDVLAIGVEVCHCPPEYTSLSCQDPGRGYYRRYKSDYLTSTVWTDLVGEAARCQCNGRSETCDRETGKCSVLLKLYILSYILIFYLSS